VAKDIFLSKPEGRRIVGRSRLRWLEGAGIDSENEEIEANHKKRRRMGICCKRGQGF
jgi:hypothetical protein